MDNNYNLQLKKGMLVLALLKVIDKQEVYVADMLKHLKTTEFETQEGTLYPLLARLKQERVIAYRWVESESGPPRKYYTLTRDGKQKLVELEAYLGRLSKEIAKLGEKL